MLISLSLSLVRMSNPERREEVDLTQTTPPSTPTSRRSPSPTMEDTMKDSTAKKKKKAPEMKNNSETEENTEITVDPRTMCKQEMEVGNREDLTTLQG